MSGSVIDTLNNRVTVRDFSADPLDDETLMTLLRAARRSPTSSNWQSYSLVIVRDAETKKALAEVARGQKHIETCPVFVALCADLSRMQLAAEMHEVAYAGNLERTIIAVIDAALVGMSLSLAAESMGLGTVMIGAIRNDPEKVAHLLGLPDSVFVVYGLCIGWPASRPPQKPRLPEELVFHHERYTADKDKAALLLQQHNRELAEHYRSLGRETPDAAWTETTARAAASASRNFMREVLGKLGFDTD